jgi:hypothetical protein
MIPKMTRLQPQMLTTCQEWRLGRAISSLDQDFARKGAKDAEFGPPESKVFLCVFAPLREKSLFIPQRDERIDFSSASRGNQTGQQSH